MKSILSALKERKGLYPYGWITLSVLGTCFAFTPYEILPLGIVSLAPLLYFLEKHRLSLRQVFLASFYFSVLLNIISYPWMLHTLQEYGFLPLPAAVILFLAYSVLVSSRYLLFFLFIYMLQKGSVWDRLGNYRLLVYPAAWTLGELWGWQLFPWYGGNILATNDYMAQWAEYTGVMGLTWLWVALSAGAVFVLREKKYFHATSYVILIVFLNLGGWYKFTSFEDKERESEKWRVALIQGSAPMKWDPPANIPYELAKVVDEITALSINSMTDSANKKPIELFVWPESAVPYLSYETSDYLRIRVQQLLAKSQVPLLFNDNRDRGSKTYSNISLLNPDFTESESYQKIYLLPFGEFLPLSESIPSLKRLFPAVSDFTAGQRRPLFQIGSVKFQTLVCYEVIVPGFALDYFQTLNKEPNVIINLTNDTWFGTSFESAQHLALSKLRAIEFRRPVLRAANSGISGLISSTGYLSYETGLFEKTYRVIDIPVLKNQGATFYATVGNYPLYILLISQFLFFFVRSRQQ